MYRTRHQTAHTSGKFFVLSSSKQVNGKPLTGKFYTEQWEDGETSEPMSYRDAMRLARIRGLQLVPWEDSKAYKKLIKDAEAEAAQAELYPASVFEDLREAEAYQVKPTPTPKPKRKRGRPKKKK